MGQVSVREYTESLASSTFRQAEIRRQFGLEAAQVALGHARADVTQVYAERDMALAAEVMRKIG